MGGNPGRAFLIKTRLKTNPAADLSSRNVCATARNCARGVKPDCMTTVGEWTNRDGDSFFADKARLLGVLLIERRMGFAARAGGAEAPALRSAELARPNGDFGERSLRFVRRDARSAMMHIYAL